MLEQAASARPRPGHHPRRPYPGPGLGPRAAGLRGDVDLAAGKRGPQGKAGVPGSELVPSPPARTSARRLGF